VTGYRKLGMVTPFGGVALLVGWTALVVAASTMQPTAWNMETPRLQ
jgi:uncharacterized membrane protein YgdD (TMEM256/DUF423 family)